MSDRALVAVDIGAGRYAISVDPGGGSDTALRRLLRPGTSVSAGPVLARSHSFDAILTTHLDPHQHAALVVVEADGRTTPHRVVPFVLATVDGLIEGDPAAVTVALRGRDGATVDPAYLRGWLQGTTDVLAEAVDARLLPLAQAFEWLDDAVRRLAGDRFECHRLPSRG